MSRAGAALALATAALLWGCSATGHDPSWEEPRWDLPADPGKPDEGASDLGQGDADAAEPPWDADGAGPLSGYFAGLAVIKSTVAVATFESHQILLLRRGPR